MRPFWIGFWIGVVFWLGLAACARADLIELRELAVTYRNHSILNGAQREPVIYPSAPSMGLNLGMKTDVLLGFGYVESEIISLTDDSQFRKVGLMYRLGVRPWENVEAGIWHLSEHNLDRSSPAGYYPFQFAAEIKYWIWRK